MVRLKEEIIKKYGGLILAFQFQDGTIKRYGVNVCHLI